MAEMASIKALALSASLSPVRPTSSARRASFRWAARTVIPQDHRQQYRVGKAVAHAVQAAQSVGDGVDVAHTGAGKGEARLIGGGEQSLSGGHIIAVGAGVLQRLKNGDNGLFRQPVGLTGGVKRPRYASTAWVRASMPVSAVVWGGRDTVSSGSSTAQQGIRHRSLTAYLW